jgi:hypothetical protein
MTGLVGIFLAVTAGWIVSSRRQLLVAIGAPFIVVLIVQTWGIAAGKGVSPPSTVTGWPGLIGYYIVQVIIFGLAFGAADQIRMRRVRRADHRSTEAEQVHQMRKALAINSGICVVALLAFLADHPLFDPGSVTKHKASGSPPVLGVGGILASAVVFGVLGVMTLMSRRSRSADLPASQPQGQAVGQIG